MSRIKIFLVVLALFTLAAIPGQAQSFTVIHNFSGAADGENPDAGPILDTHGNLYGTTSESGPGGIGTVYKLTPINGSWVLSMLYSFRGGNDGGEPYAGVTLGPDGTLYGTTTQYGGSGANGTLFNVKSAARAVCVSVVCPWGETTLHSFSPVNDDGQTPYGNVVFDSHGNLYGTTYQGGLHNGGTVYMGTHSGGTWNVSVIYSFANNPSDGYYPYAGLVLDSNGNLYGTTQNGGAYNSGTVFELSPSEGGWTETVLHTFGANTGCTNFGAYPVGGLVFDQHGNLFGGTYGYGYGGCGTIFELSPQQGGGWNFTTLYIFSATGPASTLAIDTAGNLYGTNPYGGNDGDGNVFELSLVNGVWTYADLHDFSGGNNGDLPWGGVAVTGPGGYLYGTTQYGGTSGDGVIYQINLGVH